MMGIRCSSVHNNAMHNYSRTHIILYIHIYICVCILFVEYIQTGIVFLHVFSFNSLDYVFIQVSAGKHDVGSNNDK